MIRERIGRRSPGSSRNFPVPGPIEEEEKKKEVASSSPVMMGGSAEKGKEETVP